MKVLGIETTCDETAIAVVDSGKAILSNVIASQAKIHAPYGGVIPELACRQHIEVCVPVLQEALDRAGVTMNEIDLISVAHGPGLIGALLIGVHFAQGLALAHDKPLVGVNHVEAHLYATMMAKPPVFPALGVVISGGHTALLKVDDIGAYELIGQTQDDAIGEAFDKVARLLGLPYPGGPQVEALAQTGDSTRYPLKSGVVKRSRFDFSFSGLKTAVLYLVKGQNANKHAPLIISESDKKDVAASFQKTVFEDLITKSLLACEAHGCHSILVGGGVSNNLYLRRVFAQMTDLPLYFPPKGLSLDNGAMIAGLGYHIFQKKGDSGLVEAKPRIPLCVK